MYNFPFKAVHPKLHYFLNKTEKVSANSYLSSEASSGMFESTVYWFVARTVIFIGTLYDGSSKHGNTFLAFSCCIWVATYALRTVECESGIICKYGYPQGATNYWNKIENDIKWVSIPSFPGSEISISLHVNTILRVGEEGSRKVEFQGVFLPSMHVPLHVDHYPLLLVVSLNFFNFHWLTLKGSFSKIPNKCLFSCQFSFP